MVSTQFAAGSRIKLSLLEMQGISQRISRDYGPSIVKRGGVASRTVLFSHQELLDISQEISREYSQRKIDGPSNLVLLPIDARRLHVYWHVPLKQARATNQRVVDEDQLILRIMKQDNTLSEVKLLENQPAWVDMAINAGNNSQQVLLPAAMLDSQTYSASIGSMEQNQVYSPVVFSNISFRPQAGMRTNQNPAQSALISQLMQTLPVGSSANSKKSAP